MVSHYPLDRRSFLVAGGLGLFGMSLADLRRLRAMPALNQSQERRRRNSCVFVFLFGGPSHIDLWDMKPAAPEEVRGPFKPIATTVPGVQVCEHLPLTARQMHRLAQVRSVRHEEGVHDPAVYQMLTGHKHPTSAGGLTVQPDDFPQMGCAFGYADARRAVLPRVVELPETMKM